MNVTIEHTEGQVAMMEATYPEGPWETIATADSLAALAENPIIRTHSARIGTMNRALREEGERKQQWACYPDRRVYGPGRTRDEAEGRHAAFLRGPHSRASSSAYHHVRSEPVLSRSD